MNSKKPQSKMKLFLSVLGSLAVALSLVFVISPTAANAGALEQVTPLAKKLVALEQQKKAEVPELAQQLSAELARLKAEYDVAVAAATTPKEKDKLTKEYNKDVVRAKKDNAKEIKNLGKKYKKLANGAKKETSREYKDAGKEEKENLKISHEQTLYGIEETQQKELYAMQDNANNILTAAQNQLSADVEWCRVNQDRTYCYTLAEAKMAEAEEAVEDYLEKEEAKSEKKAEEATENAKNDYKKDQLALKQKVKKYLAETERAYNNFQ